jgi:hypothetical protein
MAADQSTIAQRLLQWFHAVQDLNPKYLEPEDFALAERLRSAGVMASDDDFKTAVLRCRYPVCKTIHPSGWDWDISRLNEVIAEHAGVGGNDGR